MNLAVGQVYKAIDDSAPEGQEVVVVEVRDEENPKGLGIGYGDSAIATPIDRRQTFIHLATVHPFDIQILCAALPSHGPHRWQLVDDLHFESRRAFLYAVAGPHPVGDDG